MSFFKKVYSNVTTYDDVYTTPSSDEGESYKGIFRIAYPKWEGWDMIDGVKYKTTFPMVLESIEDIQDAVILFYKKTYWDIYGLDKVSSYSVAKEIYEQAISLGISMTTKHLQKMCNTVNYDNKYGPDILVDCRIGNKLRRMIQQICDDGEDSKRAMYYGLVSLHGHRHVWVGCKKGTPPTLRKYICEWLSNRNEDYKHE